MRMQRSHSALYPSILAMIVILGRSNDEAVVKAAVAGSNSRGEENKAVAIVAGAAAAPAVLAAILEVQAG